MTLLSLSLAFGFYLLFDALFTHVSLQDQIHFMLRHIFVTAAIILIWLIYGITSRYQSENIALKERIQTLEKYAGSTNLLTESEFQSRVKLITTGTRRRNESNHYLLVSILTPAGKPETLASLSHTISEGILSSIRAEFDLVTQRNPEQFLVFLQNTNEAGCHIVVERLRNKLRDQFNLIDPPLLCEIMKEEEMDEGTEMDRPLEGAVR
ncbi:hypothetical protein [Terribacillus sp. FSL K6-0262]|uniref:hypothetical protein n=1 Tax=Terribacillus sp. FSL K6-0262 TaxID=2921447 RepID=UPI0030EEA2BA